MSAVQLSPTQIEAFALSRGKRAKTDRIDAELIARFMAFRPETGRSLPGEKLRVLRVLTTRRAQIVEMRKRLVAQIGARTRQGVAADLEAMDACLRTMLEAQIHKLELRIAVIRRSCKEKAAPARTSGAAVSAWASRIRLGVAYRQNGRGMIRFGT